jgi:hypothetical protein
MARDGKSLGLRAKIDLETRTSTHREGRQAWLAWLCAAPMPLIGVATGLYLSMAAFDRETEAQFARSPDETVCGNGAIPFLFFGLIGGGVGGIIAGVAIAGLVTWLVRRCGRQDSNEAVTFDQNTSIGDLIATESKRKELRSEIDQIEQLVVEAENAGDAEVARKLIDYQTKLKRQLEL